MEVFPLPLPSSGAWLAQGHAPDNQSQSVTSPKNISKCTPFSTQPGVFFVAHTVLKNQIFWVFVASPKAKTTLSNLTFHNFPTPAWKWVFNLPRCATLALKTYGLGKKEKIQPVLKLGLISSDKVYPCKLNSSANRSDPTQTNLNDGSEATERA